MSVTESRDELQGLLVVMASLSHGLEQTLGRGAETVTFRAGRTVGLKSGAGQQESDLMAALAKVLETPLTVTRLPPLVSTCPRVRLPAAVHVFVPGS